MLFKFYRPYLEVHILEKSAKILRTAAVVAIAAQCLGHQY